MSSRILAISSNTFREAVRDRVLYNLIIFALLMIGAALLLGEITIGVERQLLTNLGLTAISIFGVLIAIFIGIGLVSKELDKRTLYTVLTRPVQRWEFIVGKYLGLVGTLVVNTAFMTLGFFLALLYLAHGLEKADAYILVAVYFILLQFLIVTAIALLLSSFSTPIESAVLSFAIFVIGCFNEDLRQFAQAAKGAGHYVGIAASYLIPNFSGLNVVTTVARGSAIDGHLIALNTVYALTYAAAVLLAATLVFQNRNLK